MTYIKQEKEKPFLSKIIPKMCDVQLMSLLNDNANRNIVSYKIWEDNKKI